MDSFLIALKENHQSGDECFCKGKLTAEERRSKFKIQFQSSYSEQIWRIEVDGCLVKGNERMKCDFAFYRKEFNALVLVELKGSDVTRAISQLYSTIKIFKDTNKIVPNSNWSAFIVPSRVSPKARSDIQNHKAKFLKNYGFKLTVKNTPAVLILPLR